MLDDLRWNGCDNNRNIVYDQCSTQVLLKPSLLKPALIRKSHLPWNQSLLTERMRTADVQQPMVQRIFHLEEHKKDYRQTWFISVAQSCPTLCDPTDCSTPGFSVHHQLPEPTQTHVHRVRDAIQSSHPLSSPSPPTFNLSQHQGLFQWVNSSHQVAKGLELQFQHQSFQWIFRTDFL